ncbi:MAG: serine/threonine-protein kinase [Deltaproteobacteria bacterium]|nr:serine/threonine-protein kinase [Deltaproteobacteria bacterium]
MHTDLTTPRLAQPLPRSAGSTLVGRYVLTERIGTGAHGTVWIADDLLSGGRVAIKLFHTGDHSRAARVHREIAVLRALRLPGVVLMLDEDQDEFGPFMVLELVEGSAFPGRGLPIPWETLREPARRLIEAIGRIHAAGIIHRDLKPSNVLVGPLDRVTVLDFGISLPRQSHDDRLTADFEFMGTPAYLAPEQVIGGAIGPTTDLYALGVMLYEALSGQIPHRSASIHAVLRARLTEAPVPLQQLVPEVPAPVAELIMRLLALDPEDRPPSTDAVLYALKHTQNAPALLPRLGGTQHISDAVQALCSSRSVQILGAQGSGRTRMLTDTLTAARAAGLTVLELRPASAPLESALRLLDPPLALSPELSLEEALTQLTDALVARVGKHTLVAIDDLERADPASLEVVRRMTARGCVTLRALRVSDSGGPVARSETSAQEPLKIALQRLTPEQLEPIFAGPERILHLPSDGAERLYQRTKGEPKRIADELDAWVRAGLCAWAGDRIVMDRPTLDRLALSSRPLASHSASDRPGSEDPPLAAHLARLSEWIDVAGSNATVTVLSQLTEQPRWGLELQLSELQMLGRIQLMADGAVRWIGAGRNGSRSSSTQSAAHRALASVLPPGSNNRIVHLLSGGATENVDAAHELLREALIQCDRFARDGALGQATLIAADVLAALRPMTERNELDPTPILARWVEIAMYTATSRALDAVLYELLRIPNKNQLILALEQLVRATLAVGVWTDRSATIVESIAAFDDPRLELLRLNTRINAARRVSLAREEAMVITCLHAIGKSTDPRAQSRALQWQARLAYRQGHFERAATFHRDAAQREPWISERLSAMLDAASAHMEAGQFDLASDFAAEALALCRTKHLSTREARAEWLLRAIAYRQGKELAVDQELVEAAALQDSRQTEALILLGEAAYALRASALDHALALSRRAWDLWHALGENLASLLVAGLCIRCGGVLPEGEAQRIEAQARTCTAPGVGLQVLALFALGAYPVRVSETELAFLTENIPADRFDVRLDVLSPRECIDALKSR